MTTGNETASAALARLFRGPNATMGSKWLDSVGDGMSGTSFHRLVVSTGTLSAAKTRDMYGHYRTKTQMKLTPGPYWKEDPTSSLQQDATRLNDPILDLETRLRMLRTDTVGGILLVTRLFDEEGPTTESFITILAAPSMATYDASSTEPGVLLDDIWDELTGFDPALDLTSVTRPVLAAQEGYSRAASLAGDITGLLLDAQPILLPKGQLLGRQVQIDALKHMQAFFLPEVCNIPFGFRWPTDIGYVEFRASIKAILGKSHHHFDAVVQALKPQLAPWFTAVEATPLQFQISGCRFLPFYDAHFPQLDSGIWPSSASDPEAFSPILDMLNGFAWRLWCDRQSTTATVLNRKYLATFLDQGTTAITTSTYLGASIPGRFCPNYAYHFQVHGWPTDLAASTTEGFLHQFERLSFISWHAQQHTRIAVNLHDAQSTVLLPLQTSEQQSSTAHKARTPKVSRATKDGVPFSAGTTRRRIDLTQTPPPKSTHSTPVKRLEMPSGITPFSPSSPVKVTASPYSQPIPSPGRRLDLASADPSSVPIRTVSQQVLKPFNPLLATIYTVTGRQEASNVFLNCCRLIAHHSATKPLADVITGLPIAFDSLIFVREPCRLFRHEILLPLQGLRDSTAYLPPLQSFMEHLLRQARVELTSVFDPNFFTGEFIHSLLSVESWMVSAHLPPSSTPPKTFQVYRLLQSLRHHKGQTLLLPADGLTLADAKHIGIFTYYLFAMLDLTDNFEDRKFRSSLFGKRLRAWSDLPDNPLVHGIWTQAPRQASYFWFASLQSLMAIFQTWIKSLRYHHTKGFFEARDLSLQRHLLISSQTPSPIPDRSDSLLSALQQYDTTFAIRWYQISPHDPIWTTPPPPGHLPAIANPRKHLLHHSELTDPGNKYQRTSTGNDTRPHRPDFMNSTPLMEVTVPLDPNVPVSTQLFTRLPTGITYPKFPSVPSGTSLTTICFRSSFSSPQNCCSTRLCKERKAPRNQRLHVDVGSEPWRSKPESYWTPLVTFLQDPAVSQHLRPSAALRNATPSVRWH